MGIVYGNGSAQMYVRHFALKQRLFDAGIAQGDAVFVGDVERSVTLNLQIALSSADAAAVLLGPPGVGKTTMAASTLYDATSASRRRAAVWLTTPPLTAHELLERILGELDLEPYRYSRAERVQVWRQYLAELNATDSAAFVAIERAHEIEAEVLRALDSLTAADPNGCSGARLVLMGEAVLRERLEEPALTGLMQRVRLIDHLRPLDAPRVEAYLRHAAARAGGTLERLLTHDAVTALARCSLGVPRILNHLCETALALVAARGEARVTGEQVAAAASRFGAAAPFARTADGIPVLTEQVTDQPADSSAPGTDVGIPTLDPAATMTLLGDAELESLSADLTAELFAIDYPNGDDETGRIGAPEPDTLKTSAANAR